LAKYISVPLKEIKIDENGLHLNLKAKINGKKCFLTLDTGASRTVFDTLKITELVKSKPQLIEGKLSTGLGTNSMESHSIILESFKIGNLKIPQFEAITLDLSMLNQSYQQINEAEVVGVLGSDILKNYSAKINFEKLTLKLIVK
jgi:predicted aspartyl protease